VNHGRVLIIFYRMGVAVVVMIYLSTTPARAWFARHDGHRRVSEQ
jgi:hypothetical protein